MPSYTYVGKTSSSLARRLDVHFSHINCVDACFDSCLYKDQFYFICLPSIEPLMYCRTVDTPRLPLLGDDIDVVSCLSCCVEILVIFHILAYFFFIGLPITLRIITLTNFLLTGVVLVPYISFISILCSYLFYGNFLDQADLANHIICYCITGCRYPPSLITSELC